MKSCAQNLTIDIGIATAGRRDVLSDTIAFMARMRPFANKLIVCPARPEDINAAGFVQYTGPTEIVQGLHGLPCQRNVILETSDADIVIFFDDDYLPSEDYVRQVRHLFAANPDVVMATGHVIADGVTGPGLDFVKGVKIVDAIGRHGDEVIRPVYNAYGCNMAIRMDVVRQHNLRFDEALPLYAWMEDVDFSRQMAAHGRIVWSSRLRGVHLGTKKAGRSPGKRLGYSQIANRVYLARKTTMSWKYALNGMIRNLIANIVHSPFPEPWADRRGRLAGNVLALKEWASGRLSPGRILDADLIGETVINKENQVSVPAVHTIARPDKKAA